MVECLAKHKDNFTLHANMQERILVKKDVLFPLEPLWSKIVSDNMDMLSNGYGPCRFRLASSDGINYRNHVIFCGH
jgi:hypothetical protein